MSWHAVSWALEQTCGTPSAKIVLLTLAQYANEEGACWPSRSTLAEQTEQSVDTIDRRLKDLEALGLLYRETRSIAGVGQTSSVYHLNIDLEAQKSHLKGNRRRGRPQPQSAAGEPQSAAGPAAPVRPPQPQSCGPHEPSSESSSEPSRASARATGGRPASANAGRPPVEGVHAITVEPHTKQAAAWDRYHREKNYRPIDWTTGPKVFATEWPPVHVAVVHPTPAPKPPQLPPGDE